MATIWMSQLGVGTLCWDVQCCGRCVDCEEGGISVDKYLILPKNTQRSWNLNDYPGCAEYIGKKRVV
jgi:hypothetical protein